MLEKDILKESKKYNNLPYNQVIKKVTDESGTYYIGEFIEIPEAKTNADDLETLSERMQEVLELSIETRLQEGDKIPMPIDEKANGVLTIRVPKSLHSALRIGAEREGISLNQYALYKLSR